MSKDVKTKKTTQSYVTIAAPIHRGRFGIGKHGTMVGHGTEKS